MTANQIAYWRLQEEKRANTVKEHQGWESLGVAASQAEASHKHAAAAASSAAASNLAAQASMYNAETSRVKAESDVLWAGMYAKASNNQAQASLLNAQTAAQRLGIDQGNLDVARMNAATNQLNASINQQNADTNQMRVQYEFPLGGELYAASQTAAAAGYATKAVSGAVSIFQTAKNFIN